MSCSRVHRRLTAWLALLAMVLGVLAPTVAQAMVASSDRAQWVEVCSASGMLWVKADASAESGVDQASHDAGGPMSDTWMHCPWCSLHGGAPGLPPGLATVELAARQGDLPPAFSRIAALSGVWAVAHARAPPSAA